MSELARAFTDRVALVGYLPAGFPSRDGCVAAAKAMADGGVDVFEIGLPYSDPLMDGPTIQQAVARCLDAKVGTRDVIETVRRVREATGRPALVMTYWNPVERYGPEAFARDVAAAGGCGVVTPDLIPEEAGGWAGGRPGGWAGGWLDACDREGVDPVFLVAPSSTDARLRLVAETNGGFVYAASTMGVTGARDTVSDRAEILVRRLRTYCMLPIAVGLGVSTGAQAAEVAAYADGVVVGSAFVRALLDAPSERQGRERVRDLAAELAGGVRAPGRAD